MSDSRSVPAVARLDSVDCAGRGLRVEFFRHNDRYAHQILAVGCEELPVLLLESIEGTATEIWPASPAFQALNMDELASEVAQPCAMLIGMAGRSHWSLSVCACEADTPAMTFEVACRVKEVPKWLGSSYSWGGRVELESGEHGPRLQFGSGNCRITSSALETIGLPYLFDKHKKELMFSAPGALSALQDKLPATLRWQIRFAVAEV